MGGPGQIGCPVGGLFGAGKYFVQFDISTRQFLGQVEIARYGHQDVVEVMGDASGQHAQGLQHGILALFLFQAPGAGNVAKDHDPPGDFILIPGDGGTAQGNES